MKLLLDTHLLLWAAGAPRRLPGAARRLLVRPQTNFSDPQLAQYPGPIRRV